MAKDRNEEALNLSEEILKNFELNEMPTQHIILKCLRLARLINDFDAVEWLKQEAHGFERTKDGKMTNASWELSKRSGRRFFTDEASIQKRSTRTTKNTQVKPKMVERAFTDSIAVMEATVEAAKARMEVAYDRDISVSSHSTYNAHIPAGNQQERNNIALTIRSTTERIEKVKSKIYEYILSVNYELKFGDITEDVFTRKRKSVDTNLKDICPEAIQKFISVYENLKSNNDEDWANAVHTCRRIIKEVADSLYPPSNTPIQLPGSGKSIKVGEDQYINRLIQYINSKSTSEKFSAIVGSHLKFIGERLDGVHEAANKGTHAEVTLDEAERYIIYTYLVIGDILAL